MRAEAFTWRSQQVTSVATKGESGGIGGMVGVVDVAFALSVGSRRDMISEERANEAEACGAEDASVWSCLQSIAAARRWSRNVGQDQSEQVHKCELGCELGV